jgi:hypothetical protein
VIYADE